MFFLAEAAAVSEKPLPVNTGSAGAIGTRSRAPGARKGGPHVGPPGVAAAAARIVLLLDDDELKAEAGQLWLGGAPSRSRTMCLMCSTASAGAILPLLAISSDLDVPWLAQATVDRGEALLDRAERSVDGVGHGPYRVKAAQRNLCGL